MYSFSLFAKIKISKKWSTVIPGERLPTVTSTNIAIAFVKRGCDDFKYTEYAELKNINLGEPQEARICFNLNLHKAFNPLVNMVAHFKVNCYTYPPGNYKMYT